jgi:hypothetical protein
LIVQDEDSKLPSENIGSGYPLQQHHMLEEWKPHPKPVKMADFEQVRERSC